MKKIICVTLALVLLSFTVLTASAFSFDDWSDPENIAYDPYAPLYYASSYEENYAEYSLLDSENALNNYFSYKNVYSVRFLEASGLSFDSGAGFGAVFISTTNFPNLSYFAVTIYSSAVVYSTVYLYPDGTWNVGTGLFVNPSIDLADGGVMWDGSVLAAISCELLADISSVYVTAVFDSEVTEFTGYMNSKLGFIYSGEPTVDSVTVASPASPYYPGHEYQFTGLVSGGNLNETTSSLYWYVRGNTSAETWIDHDGKLSIANDETASVLEVEAISTYDSTKSATVSVPVTYPLNLQIVPSQTTLISSAKRQEIQFEVLLPSGQPFDYSFLEWTTPGADGQYFRIDDNGLLEILPGAPAGSVTVKYAYQHDTGNVSTTSAIVTITTQQEGIYDQLTPTPEQSDKADQMEDAIGDAADKLENNNSSLGQLTPTRPQINTDLQLDPDKLIAVSPLVTNIWSISGLQSLIGIVVLVATVAYIFFGKRDG